MGSRLGKRVQELAQLLNCFDKVVEDGSDHVLWVGGGRVVAFGSHNIGQVVRVNSLLTCNDAGLWFHGEAARYLLENG